MEAATPLHQTTVRPLGDRLVVDGLVIDDACAIRLVTEAPDAARMLLDAIEVGARILDREQVDLHRYGNAYAVERSDQIGAAQPPLAESGLAPTAHRERRARELLR